MADKSENPAEQVSEIRKMPNLWLRKMITVIDAWDLDKDGHAVYDDVMKIADKFIKVASDSPNLENATATSLLEQLVAIWRGKDNPAAMKMWCKIYSDMFKIIDLDASGFLTFDQYLVFWNTFNLNERFAKMQFDYMDTDNEGKISEQEFMNAFKEYVQDTEEDKLNRFFGPLIKY